MKITLVKSPVPEVGLVPDGIERPYWSVMIPTYNCTDLLETTLRSVLGQDPGAEKMQIAVVDDCSSNSRSREIVARLAPRRVEFSQGASNVGLAGNWNACLALSRGHWVHILHQDDLVLPGLYERLARGARERPDIGAAFCRPAEIDCDGVRSYVYPLEQSEAGVLEAWADRIAVEQRILCPTIAVKRSVYEAIGGFRPDLAYLLDWEMWIRIAFQYPVWYEPEILAHWRNYDGSESARLAKLNAQLPDYGRLFAIIYDYAPKERRDALVREAARLARWRWHLEVVRLMESGDPGKALGHIHTAYRYEDPLTRVRTLLVYCQWAVKVWLRHLLSGGGGKGV